MPSSCRPFWTWPYNTSHYSVIDADLGLASMGWRRLRPDDRGVMGESQKNRGTPQWVRDSHPGVP